MRLNDRIAKLELAIGSAEMSPQEAEATRTKLLRLFESRCNAQPIQPSIEATPEQKAELLGQLKELAARMRR